MNLKDNGKIQVEIKTRTIRQVTEMAKIMLSDGTLYKDHPMTVLINEIIDSATNKLKQIADRKN